MSRDTECVIGNIYGSNDKVESSSNRCLDRSASLAAVKYMEENEENFMSIRLYPERIRIERAYHEGYISGATRNPQSLHETWYLPDDEDHFCKKISDYLGRQIQVCPKSRDREVITGYLVYHPTCNGLGLQITSMDSETYQYGVRCLPCRDMKCWRPL
jgi:hypothetical protein